MQVIGDSHGSGFVSRGGADISRLISRSVILNKAEISMNDLIGLIPLRIVNPLAEF